MTEQLLSKYNKILISKRIFSLGIYFRQIMKDLTSHRPFILKALMIYVVLGLGKFLFLFR